MPMGYRLKRIIIIIAASAIGIPLIIAIILFSLLTYEGFKYHRFQEKVKFIYSNSKHDLLKVSVCHEWKCIFEYKDKRSEYMFLIFGEKNLEERVHNMIEISSVLPVDIEKCRYIQQGSNVCQI